MEKEETVFKRDFGELLDVDISDSGSWVGVFRRDKDTLVVRFDGEEFVIPQSLRCPLIRFLGHNQILLVDSRSQEEQVNAWIFGFDGVMLKEFPAGDRISNLVCTQSIIAVSYSDEGILSSNPLSQEGLYIFDHSGNPCFGYKTQLGEKAVDITDCYALCEGKAETLWFYPFEEFPLVSLHPIKREQTLFSTPALLEGSTAITTHENVCWFYSPYDRRGGIFKWEEGGVVADEVAKSAGPLRGLFGGRFVLTERQKFTVFYMADNV